MISYYILLSYIFPREFLKIFLRKLVEILFISFHENSLIFLEINLKFSWKIPPKKVVTESGHYTHRKRPLNFYINAKS